MATFDGTTLARVRLALFKAADDTSFDELLAQLITTASRQVERWLNAPFSAEARVETFTVEDGSRTKFFLGASPVSAITSVKVDGTGAYSGDETTLDASSYILEPNEGVVGMRFEPSLGFQRYRVSYTGGLAATTAALIAEYPELATAIDMQTAYLFHMSDRPHIEQQSLGGAAVKVGKMGGLCPLALETCAHLRRYRF